MANGGDKNKMNTVDKIINDISQKLATSIVDTTYYKVLYDESQEKLAEAQAQLEQAQAQLEQAQARLNEVSQTLEADEALKELFDEVAQKLEKE
nr:MAG TPA: Protein phosphatase 1 regulatory subunit KINSASE G - I [Caudoviricetes sp.]